MWLAEQAEEELHRDKALLGTLSQELDRLMKVWKRVSEGKGGSYRNRHELQTEVAEVRDSMRPDDILDMTALRYERLRVFSGRCKAAGRAEKAVMC